MARPRSTENTDRSDALPARHPIGFGMLILFATLTAPANRRTAHPNPTLLPSGMTRALPTPRFQRRKAATCGILPLVLLYEVDEDNYIE